MKNLPCPGKITLQTLPQVQLSVRYSFKDRCYTIIRDEKVVFQMTFKDKNFVGCIYTDSQNDDYAPKIAVKTIVSTKNY